MVEKATELRLVGYVRNLPSGRDVEVRAEGERKNLEYLVEYLKVGPSEANVIEIKITWSKYIGKYSRFTVLS